MAITTLNNKSVHYREWGSGDNNLVMLHGWPADSTHYSELGPLLAKQGFHVYVPDFPGWGQTPKPDNPWTVSEYRDWVHAFVSSLGLTSYHLFGHSFGGRVSIKYAIKYATELKTITLCAAAGIKPDPYTAKRRTLKTVASAGKALFKIPLLNRFESFAKKVLYKAAGSNDYLKAEGVMKETIVKVLEEDLSPLLPQVHPRTLILWGSEDGATPLSDAEKMHKLIKNSKLKILKGERHNLPKNAPEKVADELADFLSAVESL